MWTEMALVRCATCGVPKGRARTYVRYVNPVGYPDGGLICGIASCGRPGLIWLDEKEAEAYKKGERVFELPTAAAKVKAQ